MLRDNIPFYDLYGEAFIRKEPNIAHVEDIASRSLGLGWQIQPHRHNRLSQIVAVFNNSWTVELDERQLQLDGHWLVLIPAGVVHSFQFASDTKGFVLSINDSLLGVSGASDAPNSLAGLADLVWQAQAIEFKDRRQIEHFCTYLNLLKQELSADQLGQNMAVEKLVQLILLTVLRQQRLQAMTVGSANRESTLLLKFRTLIEQHYTEHLAVKDYAERLHISVSKLNRLCQNLLKDSPKAVIHQRLVIEAKRLLIYTKQSVEEISSVLGFNDPAYFSRFFKHVVGLTAGAFRQQGNIT